MRNVTLEDVFKNPVTQKYVGRSGMAHAISAAEFACMFAKQYNVDPDLAAKAAFLHDIGHYTWYRNGEWDYKLYKDNDIHAIKGANRAHELLVSLGEDRHCAKEIALAILLHTDSYLPEGHLNLNPLQEVVAKADEADEEPGGSHHYKTIDYDAALDRIRSLDRMIDQPSSELHTLEQTS